MMLLICLISFLAHASARAEDECKKAHDPVKKGQKAPCTGVQVPKAVAIECAVLKKASETWDQIFAKQKELSEVERSGLKALLEKERERTKAANARGDALEAKLGEVSQELVDRNQWYESPAFWAPVTALVSVIATVLIYEYAR